MVSEKELKQFLKQSGIKLFSAGHIARIKSEFPLSKELDLTGIDYAISLAYPLPEYALSGIQDKPTLLYKHIYRQVNNLLDRITLQIAVWLEEQGARAIPIPASQIIDWEKNLAHLSHRQVASHLGLGFYGRNNLLIIPGFGARTRLATVLTDMELYIPGGITEKNSGCGNCNLCALVCPVKAIHTGPEDFDRKACFARVKEFEKLRGIGVGICGICVKACPAKKTSAHSEPGK
jgi:epoxyqueuosine reductase QueG